MKLVIKNESVQFDTTPSSEEIMNSIDKLLDKDDCYSHLIVDGEEVYEELETYLSDISTAVSTIEIIVKTIHEFIGDIIQSNVSYLVDAIPEMTKLADQFYQNPKSDSWSLFSAMLEGMQWLNQTINSIDKSKGRPEHWNECIKQAVRLQMELKNLEQAIENNDYVLTADIIQYELIPIYEDLQRQYEMILNTQFQCGDIN